MQDMAYQVRGYITVRRKSLPVALSGSLTIRAGADARLFTGDLVLDPSTVSRTVLGAGLFRASVQVTPQSPVIGGFDHEGGVLATVAVSAVISEVSAAGRPLFSGRSCHTARHAVVPLRSGPGFDLQRGGRLTGSYQRPPFTGCGRMTPLVNLLIAGPGNIAVVDLIPLAS